jgi:hypothetical protein
MINGFFGSLLVPLPHRVFAAIHPALDVPRLIPRRRGRPIGKAADGKQPPLAGDAISEKKARAPFAVTLTAKPFTSVS